MGGALAPAGPTRHPQPGVGVALDPRPQPAPHPGRQGYGQPHRDSFKKRWNRYYRDCWGGLMSGCRTTADASPRWATRSTTRSGGSAPPAAALRGGGSAPRADLLRWHHLPPLLLRGSPAGERDLRRALLRVGVSPALRPARGARGGAAALPQAWRVVSGLYTAPELDAAAQVLRQRSKALPWAAAAARLDIREGALSVGCELGWAMLAAAQR